MFWYGNPIALMFEIIILNFLHNSTAKNKSGKSK